MKLLGRQSRGIHFPFCLEAQCGPAGHCHTAVSANASVFVSYCCCDKLPQTLPGNNTSLLTYSSGDRKPKTGLRELKPRCGQNWFLLKVHGGESVYFYPAFRDISWLVVLQHSNFWFHSHVLFFDFNSLASFLQGIL